MQSKENKPKTIKNKDQKSENKTDIDNKSDVINNTDDKKKNDIQLKKESKTKTIKSETFSDHATAKHFYHHCFDKRKKAKAYNDKKLYSKKTQLIWLIQANKKIKSWIQA